jgi:hypothetical protein
MVLIGSGYRPGALVLIGIQAIAAAAALVGLVAAARGRDRVPVPAARIKATPSAAKISIQMPMAIRLYP